MTWFFAELFALVLVIFGAWIAVLRWLDIHLIPLMHRKWILRRTRAHVARELAAIRAADRLRIEATRDRALRVIAINAGVRPRDGWR
jgi:hypothetical protein